MLKSEDKIKIPERPAGTSDNLKNMNGISSARFISFIRIYFRQGYRMDNQPSKV